MNLPIDITTTNPLKFKWQQKMESLVGTRVQECEGALPSGVDVAVKMLIDQLKVSEKDNQALHALLLSAQDEVQQLRKQVEGHVDRIAAQSEIITKKAEVKRGK